MLEMHFYVTKSNFFFQEYKVMEVVNNALNFCLEVYMLTAKKLRKNNVFELDPPLPYKKNKRFRMRVGNSNTKKS